MTLEERQALVAQGTWLKGWSESITFYRTTSPDGITRESVLVGENRHWFYHWSIGPTARLPLAEAAVAVERWRWRRSA